MWIIRGPNLPVALIPRPTGVSVTQRIAAGEHVAGIVVSESRVEVSAG